MPTDRRYHRPQAAGPCPPRAPCCGAGMNVLLPRLLCSHEMRFHLLRAATKRGFLRDATPRNSFLQWQPLSVRLLTRAAKAPRDNVYFLHSSCCAALSESPRPCCKALSHSTLFNRFLLSKRGVAFGLPDGPQNFCQILVERRKRRVRSAVLPSERELLRAPHSGNLPSGVAMNRA